MRLERIIQIKKLMFIHSIMKMNDDDLPKKIFCERANFYFNNEQFGMENTYQSAVFDLLNVSDVFGLLKEVKSMVQRQHFYTKSGWKSIVWKKGWFLEDLHWKIEKQMHRSLDHLGGVSPVNRYLTWWMISDKYSKLTRDCEILVKIISHASILKSDDFKYKRLPGTDQMCSLCDGFLIEDARHLILECTHFNLERESAFREIEGIEDGSGVVFFEGEGDLLYKILGKPDDRLDIEQLERIWLITLKFVSTVYKINVNSKKGIG